MKKQIIMFGNIKIEKYKFHNHKSPILVDDEDIDKILISNKVSCKKVINILLVTKMKKKLNHYV